MSLPWYCLTARAKTQPSLRTLTAARLVSRSFCAISDRSLVLYDAIRATFEEKALNTAIFIALCLTSRICSLFDV